MNVAQFTYLHVFLGISENTTLPRHDIYWSAVVKNEIIDWIEFMYWIWLIVSFFLMLTTEILAFYKYFGLSRFKNPLILNMKWVHQYASDAVVVCPYFNL
jgi:hypothetical protein